MDTIINNIRFYRTNNDINGNPRYIVHFLNFLTKDEIYKETDVLKDYETAAARAKKLGFRKYKRNDFGGGFVITSYNLYDVEKRISELLKTIELC